MTIVAERIQITQETVREVQNASVERSASLVVRDADGHEVPLPSSVQTTIFRALEALAVHGSVSIETVPQELTSTVAAEFLGVSRPTLMKWAREGVIASHMVGTHHRFDRDDVLELRDARTKARRKAVDELREWDAAHPDFVVD